MIKALAEGTACVHCVVAKRSVEGMRTCMVGGSVMVASEAPDVDVM